MSSLGDNDGEGATELTLPGDLGPVPTALAPARAERGGADGATSSELLLELNALLGRGTHYTGKLHFEGRVRIEGRFEGEIRGDDVLVIGEGAEVDAEIHVGVCIVTGGRVHANIYAREAIELHVPAVVVGELRAPNIFIDRGVQFEGNCKMAPLDPDLVPVARARPERARWQDAAASPDTQRAGPSSSSPLPSLDDGFADSPRPLHASVPPSHASVPPLHASVPPLPTVVDAREGRRATSAGPEPDQRRLTPPPVAVVRPGDAVAPAREAPVRIDPPPRRRRDTPQLGTPTDLPPFSGHDPDDEL